MNARPLLLAALVSLLASAQAAATGLAVVSPGSPSGALLVSSPWPTFSWTDPGRAEAVEVLVYPVFGDGSLAQRPVIQERMPAGARSYTPAGHGLAPGATYAWTVRALGPEAMQASEPALFRVAAVEPREELEEALAIIERYLVANGRSPLPTPAGAALDGAESGSVFDGVPQESAISGEVSVDGTGGLMAAAVSVTGFSCADCVDSSAIGFGDVSGADIQDGTITGSDIAPQSLEGAPFSDFASNSIDRTRILDGTLTAADLGENSVGAAEIASGAVGSSEIASDAVTSLELAVDAVAEIDIGNEAVGGAQLGDVRVVSVECFGDCSDSSLGTVCGAGYRALLVDCESIANAGAGSNCGGDNVCVQSIVADNLSLGSYCADAVGWDAHVFCLSD